MTTFTVSAIIPAYNEVSRISRAIESILRQTCPIDEILVIDDGSQDGTVDAVRACGEKVRCLQQPNQGPSAARNNGIQQARSEWVAFLDADDEWLPEHIANAQRILKEHPEIQWFCAAYRFLSEDGKMDFICGVDEGFLEKGIISNYFLAQAKTSFSRPSAMIVRKRALVEAGLFNIDFNRGEDLDLWFRIALRHTRIAYCNTPGCIYRYHAGSLTTRDSRVNIQKFIRRIETSLAASLETGLATRESTALVSVWVIQASKDAIRQQDRDALQQIGRTFPKFLPIQWKTAVRILQIPLVLKIAGAALAKRNALKRPGL